MDTDIIGLSQWTVAAMGSEIKSQKYTMPGMDVYGRNA